MLKRRVAFVTTHPIQYQAPVFRVLAQRREIDFTVFFCQIPTRQMQGDGFGVEFDWDIPLLEGYQYQVLRNVARNPSLTHFDGCDTPELRDRIRDERYDAVIVNGWVVKSCLQTLDACRRANVPCIVRGEANVMRPRAWWKRALHKRLIRRYSAYLCIGSSNREFYERNGARPDQLFPAYYCIENERFSQSATDDARNAVRERLGLRPEDVCYLFCGKFIDKKHPLELVAAFRQAASQGCQAHLIMVGDGPLKAACESLARSEQLKVIFAGFVNQREMPSMYAAADCLVLPSDHGETWGLVVNEAMACRKPAIVSDQVGCGPDLIIPGRTGAVFPMGNWGKLAEQLREFGHSLENLRNMGAQAYSLIQNYSPEAAAQGVIDAVRFVTARTGTAGSAQSNLEKQPN